MYVIGLSSVTSLPDSCVRQISPWNLVWLRKRAPAFAASASTNQKPALWRVSRCSGPGLPRPKKILRGGAAIVGTTEEQCETVRAAPANTGAGGHASVAYFLPPSFFGAAAGAFPPASRPPRRRRRTR